MWGGSFADLAKKAQEAAEQASALSAGFSLDKMQGDGAAESKKPAAPQPTSATPSPSTTSLFGTPAATAPPTQSPSPGGGLSSWSNFDSKQQQPTRATGVGGAATSPMANYGSMMNAMQARSKPTTTTVAPTKTAKKPKQQQQQDFFSSMGVASAQPQQQETDTKPESKTPTVSKPLVQKLEAVVPSEDDGGWNQDAWGGDGDMDVVENDNAAVDSEEQGSRDATMSTTAPVPPKESVEAAAERSVAPADKPTISTETTTTTTADPSAPSEVSVSNDCDEMDVARKRLTALFEMHNPSKVGAVEALVVKYKGNYDILYAKIEEKYSGDTTESKKTPKPKVATSAPPVDDMVEARDRLTAIFQKYNPSKLDSIQALVVKYRGNYDVLFAKIEEKYGIVNDENTVNATELIAIPLPAFMTASLPSQAAAIKLFDELDENGNDTLSYGELGTVWGAFFTHFQEHKISLMKAYNIADENQDGMLRRDEFEMFLRVCVYYHNCYDEFEAAGQSSDRLRLEEFRTVAPKFGIPAKAADKVFGLIDGKHSGHVRFAQFCGWMAKKTCEWDTSTGTEGGKAPVPSSPPPTRKAVEERRTVDPAHISSNEAPEEATPAEIAGVTTETSSEMPVVETTQPAADEHTTSVVAESAQPQETATTGTTSDDSTMGDNLDDLDDMYDNDEEEEEVGDMERNDEPVVVPVTDAAPIEPPVPDASGTNDEVKPTVETAPVDSQNLEVLTAADAAETPAVALESTVTQDSSFGELRTQNTFEPTALSPLPAVAGEMDHTDDRSACDEPKSAEPEEAAAADTKNEPPVDEVADESTTTAEDAITEPVEESSATDVAVKEQVGDAGARMDSITEPEPAAEEDEVEEPADDAAEEGTPEEEDQQPLSEIAKGSDKNEASANSEIIQDRSFIVGEVPVEEESTAVVSREAPLTSVTTDETRATPPAEEPSAKEDKGIFGFGLMTSDAFGFNTSSLTTSTQTKEETKPIESKPVGVPPSQTEPPIASRAVSRDLVLPAETNGEGADQGTSSSDGDMVPASVLDQYASQIQRLEEHHNSEMEELRRHHATELRKLKDSSDACEAERRDLELQFMTKIGEKDSQLREIMQINEGMKLKVDMLKRELTGTQQLLTEKENALGTASATSAEEKRTMEAKLKEVQGSAGTAKADIYQLKEQLKAKKVEIEKSNEAYDTLKARVKVVATELKERRAECRTLTQKVGEVTETNEQLQTQIANMESQLSDHDRSHSAKQYEMDDLMKRVKALEEEVKQADKKVAARGVEGEKALSAYKKKAQNALAVANARSAAMVQAKEEAEMEAAAAKTASEEAITKAREAESNGRAALEEAKGYVKEMQDEKAALENKAEEAFEELRRRKQEFAASKQETLSARAAKDKLSKELSDVRANLQLERNLTSELQQEVSDLQGRSATLHGEVETLREEMRKNATAVLMAKQQQQKDGAADANGSSHILPLTSFSTDAAEKKEAEATILMLQRELKDSNQAIKELKETLRATIEQQQQQPQMSDQYGMSNAAAGGMNGTANDASNSEMIPEPFRAAGGPTSSRSQQQAQNDSTPLFYAMEKQAELNTARDEINRLANLLGDAQSEKMEALEAMSTMKQRMEEATARLQRFEKLGSAPVTDVKEQTAHNPLVGGRNAQMLGTPPPASPPRTDAVESAQVNLEYLKNVMLRFLDAKTYQEKKALVPVVASVLCLTPEESVRAMASVEQSGSVENVGLSLFENLGSQVGFKLI